MAEQLYILYDGRAKSGDTDDAAILYASESEFGCLCMEARDLKQRYDGVWYVYDVVDDNQLVNERLAGPLGLR